MTIDIQKIESSGQTMQSTQTDLLTLTTDSDKTYIALACAGAGSASQRWQYFAINIDDDGATDGVGETNTGTTDEFPVTVAKTFNNATKVALVGHSTDDEIATMNNGDGHMVILGIGGGGAIGKITVLEDNTGSSDETTTSTTFTDTTLSVTLPSSGKYLATSHLPCKSSDFATITFRYNDGSTDNGQLGGFDENLRQYTITMFGVGLNHSNTLKIEWKTSAHTATIFGDSEVDGVLKVMAFQ